MVINLLEGMFETPVNTSAWAVTADPIFDLLEFAIIMGAFYVVSIGLYLYINRGDRA